MIAHCTNIQKATKRDVYGLLNQSASILWYDQWINKMGNYENAPCSTLEHADEAIEPSLAPFPMQLYN